MTRLATGACLLLFSLAASAGNPGTGAGKLLQNGSFETGQVANPCFIFDIGVGSTLITGWTVSRGTIDWDGPPPCSVVASDGAHSLDLVGQIGIGGIQQAFQTTPGRCYKISFDLAGNPEAGNPPVMKPLTVNITNAGTAFIATNTPQAQGCAPIANGMACTFTFDVTGKTQANMGWVRQTIKFGATSTSATVEFVSDITAAGPPGNAGANLDKVGAGHAHGC